MGEAYNRAGEVLGSATGATKSEVLEKLAQEFPDAAEIRIRSAERGPLASDGSMGSVSSGFAPNAGVSMRPPYSERLSLDNVDEAFNYQPWDNAQQLQGAVVRSVLVAAARAILANVPESPLRTRALNHLIDARMIANAAITFRGRF